jgi:hypothetical protein
MPDDFADDIRRHNEMIEALAKVWMRQGELNEDQRLINDRLTTAIERIEVTLARVETLLTRLPRGETNGRDA